LKILIFALVTLMSLSAFSGPSNKEKKDNKKNEKKGFNRHPKPLSSFDVVPLNSPVKESIAKFLIKFPEGFSLNQVKYKIESSSRFFDGEEVYKKINVVNGSKGKELHVSVSKLPPGFYKFFVKFKDSKKKVHKYKTKFKDHAMFVIDTSLEVKMPDPKVNNATLLGVDSDNDGIRDDVQIWIDENFKNKPLELKLAFKQYATDVQTSMPTSNDKTASIIASHATIKSQICLYEMGDLLGVPGKEQELTRQKIELMYLNTRERIEDEIKADKNFHGQSGTMLSREEACRF